MAPEYGATMGFFPVDAESPSTTCASPAARGAVASSSATAKEQGLFYDTRPPEPVFTDTLELDLSTVVPSLAGPKRPQDRVPSRHEVRLPQGPRRPRQGPRLRPRPRRPTGGRGTRGEVETFQKFDLGHGAVVIAAITSCTNTSNPSVMLAAGLVAKKAVERGPHRQALGQDLARARLARSSPSTSAGRACWPYLEPSASTSSATAAPPASATPARCPRSSAAIKEGNLVAGAVLSGNRNFEGRVHPHVKANYLASPPLVVAYASPAR
jgi:aconitate hydratase